MITAITLTGDRPLAFGLCFKWMQNQVIKPDQWIVVDDGKEPIQDTFGFEYVRREPKINDPKHTMLLNLNEAVSRIQFSKILIIEDDEYYHPNYIKEMSTRLDKYEIVGIGQSKYYHLPTGGWVSHKNFNHASFAQTGFKNTVLPEISRLLAWQDMFIDAKLWARYFKDYKQNKYECIMANGRGLIFSEQDTPLYCGIKGLPGRSGIGIGHRESIYHAFDDPSRSILRRWIPENYQDYLDVLERTK